MAVSCRMLHLCMQNKAAHSDSWSRRGYAVWAEETSSIYSPSWIFSPALPQSRDASSCKETEKKSRICKNPGIGSRVPGKAVEEALSAEGRQQLPAGKDHTHWHHLHQQSREARSNLSLWTEPFAPGYTTIHPQTQAPQLVVGPAATTVPDPGMDLQLEGGTRSSLNKQPGVRGARFRRGPERLCQQSESQGERFCCW